MTTILIGIVLVGLWVLLSLGNGTSDEQDDRRAREARPSAPPAAPPRLSATAKTPVSVSLSHPERTMPTNHTPSLTNGTAAARRYELDAAKTLHAFDFILKSFGQTPCWATRAGRDDLVYDLTVMLRHGDLERASLELLGTDHTVLYRHRVEFGKHGGPAAVDAAGGIELPLLPSGKVAAHRLLMGPTACIDSYRHELRRNWTPALRLAERAGSRFQSEHTQRVNAGRLAGEVFVTDEARQTLTVINVVAAGAYAFGSAPGLAANVYLHRAQCDEPLAFVAGQRLSCVVIQTPRGLQGRNIRAVPGAAQR